MGEAKRRKKLDPNFGIIPGKHNSKNLKRLVSFMADILEEFAKKGMSAEAVSDDEILVFENTSVMKKYDGFAVRYLGKKEELVKSLEDKSKTVHCERHNISYIDLDDFFIAHGEVISFIGESQEGLDSFMDSILKLEKIASLKEAT